MRMRPSGVAAISPSFQGILTLTRPAWQANQRRSSTAATAALKSDHGRRERAVKRGCRALLVAFPAIGCASSTHSTSLPASATQTSVASSRRPVAAAAAAAAAAGSAPTRNRSIHVLLSSESDRAFCNGERMDSDGYRRTLTREQDVALPATGGSLRDDIHAVLDVATTGMCNTVMQQLDIRVERDKAHIPPISGWAGVSIVMCHCIPEVELNLVRIPGIARVVWDQDEGAPTR
jgi:hypothetical protein